MTDESMRGDTASEPDVDLRDTTGSVEAERGPEQSVDVTVDGTVYRLSAATASELESELDNVMQRVRGDYSDASVLKFARKRTLYNTRDNPFHLKGEYGCQHSDTVSGYVVDVNVAELAMEPVYNRHHDWWEVGERDSRMAFEKYFDLFVCNFCQETLEYWHTQRQIFLPKLADQITLDEIDGSSFTPHDTHQGACDVCGTAQSGVAQFDAGVSVFGVESPFVVCPTCRDLLIDAESQPVISREALSSHPHNTAEFTVQKPITDPDFSPKQSPETNTIPTDPIEELSEDLFTRIVEQFDGVTSGTAERLYENGFDSIPGLATARKTRVTDVSLVGGSTADVITDGAAAYVDAYHSAFDERSLPPSESELVSLVN